MPGGYQRFPFDQSRSNVIKRKLSLAYASARFPSGDEIDEEGKRASRPPFLN